MEKETRRIEQSTREVLGWDIPGMGLFEATFWNGKLMDVRMHKEGSCMEGANILWITENSEGFLRAVYKSLGELLEHMDRGKK